MIESKCVYLENGDLKASSDSIPMYKKAKHTSEKIKCFVARLFHTNVVTPFGRIVLLPSDYEKMVR